jgi:hypothetical protein
MDTRQIAKDFRLSHWAEILSQRRESGLNVKEYCEREGIRQNRYFYWQKKLREAACEQVAGSQADYNGTTLVPPGFTEARLQNPYGLSSLGSTRDGAIHFVYAGVHVSIAGNYPPAQVAELLRKLVQL